MQHHPNVIEAHKHPLAPRRILMPAGNPSMRDWYEQLGIEVKETPMDELRKASGAVGCLTGVVERGMA